MSAWNARMRRTKAGRWCMPAEIAGRRLRGAAREASPAYDLTRPAPQQLPGRWTRRCLLSPLDILSIAATCLLSLPRWISQPLSCMMPPSATHCGPPRIAADHYAALDLFQMIFNAYIILDASGISCRPSLTWKDDPTARRMGSLTAQNFFSLQAGGTCSEQEILQNRLPRRPTRTQ